MLRIIFPKLKHLSLYVLIFAIIIEFMQLLKITEIISNNNKILSIALGGTFDVKDIICYTLGFIIIVISERSLKQWKIRTI